MNKSLNVCIRIAVVFFLEIPSITKTDLHSKHKARPTFDDDATKRRSLIYPSKKDNSMHRNAMENKAPFSRG